MTLSSPTLLYLFSGGRKRVCIDAEKTFTLTEKNLQLLFLELLGMIQKMARTCKDAFH